jgi:hypothetical protein
VAASEPSLLEEEELFIASTDDLPSWFAISFEMTAEGCHCEKRVCGRCVDRERFPLHRFQDPALRDIQDLPCRRRLLQTGQGAEEQ